MRERIERVPVESIHSHPELTPPHDAVLTRLLESALKGDVPVYFAAIPLRLIKPFADFYDPRRHPVGRQAIAMIQERWRNQQFTNMLVYPRDDVFVMSDNYIAYYACLEGKPDYVACWIVGHCTSPDACDVQGPIRKEDLRKVLFGSDD